MYIFAWSALSKPLLTSPCQGRESRWVSPPDKGDLGGVFATTPHPRITAGELPYQGATSPPLRSPPLLSERKFSPLIGGDGRRPEGVDKIMGVCI